MRITSLALLLSLFACSESAFARQVEILTGGGQEQYLQRGARFISSTLAQSTVVAAVEPLDGRRAWVSLAIVNHSTLPIDVLESNVRLASSNSNARKYFAGEVIKRERRRDFWDRFGADLSAAIDSYNASQSGSFAASGTFRGDAASSSAAHTSRIEVDGSYWISGTDPVARELAVQNAAARAQEARTRLLVAQNSRAQVLATSLLMDHTVAPGDLYEGRLLVELPRAARRAPYAAELTVSLAGDVHKFVLAVDDDQRSLGSTLVSSPPNRSPLGSAVTVPPVKRDAPETVGSAVSASGAGLLESGQIAVQIDGLEIQSKRAASGGIEEYLFFNLTWTIPRSHVGKKVAGNLVVADSATGREIVLRWPLDAADTRSTEFKEREVGFSMASLGAAGGWLRSTSLQNLTARYEPAYSASRPPREASNDAVAIRYYPHQGLDSLSFSFSNPWWSVNARAKFRRQVLEIGGALEWRFVVSEFEVLPQELAAGLRAEAPDMPWLDVGAVLVFRSGLDGSGLKGIGESAGFEIVPQLMVPVLKGGAVNGQGLVGIIRVEDFSTGDSLSVDEVSQPHSAVDSPVFRTAHTLDGVLTAADQEISYALSGRGSYNREARVRSELRTEGVVTMQRDGVEMRFSIEHYFSKSF